jgi:hypothetical protein
MTINQGLTYCGDGTYRTTSGSPGGYTFYEPQQYYPTQTWWGTTNVPSAVIKNTTKEGIEMLGLYNVVLVYAEDRKKPEIQEVRGVIAAGSEDAKVKSGLMAKISPDWDADYLTIEAVKVIDVKVKAKPQEVKQV